MASSPTHQAQVAAPLQSIHGEGPIWDPARQRILSVDLTEGRIHAYAPSNGTVETKTFDEPVCALGPHPDGRIVVAFAKRLAWLDWDSSQITEICKVEADKPGNRCNDGKLDPAGRFWIGTMSNDGSVEGAGGLYRLDGETLTPVLDNLTIANGLGWTSDQKSMFFIDSPTREVWAFDFDPADSSIRNRRTVVRVPEELGMPDGMCVSQDDTIWVAHWGPGCVGHWDPTTGELLEIIKTGCPHTTSCDFDDQNRLYITTSQLGLSPEALAQSPASGNLFTFKPAN